jgi:hypothetical protein
MNDELISVGEAAARLGIGRLAMLDRYRRGEVAGRVVPKDRRGLVPETELRLDADSVERFRERVIPADVWDGRGRAPTTGRGAAPSRGGRLEA